ncbi:hypothetical protein [Amycolatopsis thermoflava]|uniref:Uncharacterized protein n=1 Tax=Amycolatopsis thermoflava TaxID=84480 RepID=A0A3N2GVN6_9PSEU|nr:hypothetical protein [Amycolatopsis thermoflava]ROS40065.1 hypothetical protein EDD35_2392 [Amycolatopsis thermoflava]
MGFELVLEKIEATGRAASRVAEGLLRVDPAGALPPGDAGMPGARAADKLAAVVQVWQGRSRAAGELLAGYAARIGKAVELYHSSDDAAARDLTAAARPKGWREPI